MPHPKGVGPQHPQNFWDLQYACIQYEKNKDILHYDQTRCEEHLGQQSRPQMPTCNLFAVTNLLVHFILYAWLNFVTVLTF